MNKVLLLIAFAQFILVLHDSPLTTGAGRPLLPPTSNPEGFIRTRMIVAVNKNIIIPMPCGWHLIGELSKESITNYCNMHY